MIALVLLGVLAGVLYVGLGRRGEGSRSGPAVPSEVDVDAPRRFLWPTGRLRGHGGGM